MTADRETGGDGRGDRPRERRAPPADAVAFAEGSITRQDAMDRLRVRDYAGLLVVLGYHGLAPPRPSDQEIEEQAMVFERVWNAVPP